MTNPVLIPLQSDYAYLVKLGDLAEDAPTVLSIVEDPLLLQDLDDNLDNFYVKVAIEEQDATPITIPVYKNRLAGHVANLPLHSFFMSHAGRFRVVKSNRTWFNLDMSNKYSVAGRLF